MSATRKSIATFDGAPDDFSVALSADGHLLAVGGFGRVVRVWDVRTRRLVHQLDQGGNGAFTLEFTPTAGPSPSPGSSPSRPSGMSRPELRSARSSPPGTAGR